MPNPDVVTVATNAGMLALWRGTAYADVDGYDAWEEQVNDRLDDAIESGELVPIGIQSDGAFGVRVAVSPDGATDREKIYEVVTSEPYLLVADGGPILLSGIEGVGHTSSSPIALTLPKGDFAVRATIVAWDEEPGQKAPDGGPGPDALPDFLITVVPRGEMDVFRTNEMTFDPPD